MTQKPIALVTGGAGFIGSHMVDVLLAEGYAVRIIDNLVSGHLGNLKHLKGERDVTVDTRDLRELVPGDSLFAGLTYVFHFAGIGDIVPSIEKPMEYMSANVMGTVHALEGARRSGVRKFIYAASSSCYGLAKELPTTEAAEITPQYPYALSKYQGEQAAFHWHKVYGLPVNSIRMFNVYGPRSRTTGAYGAVFGVFLKQKLEHKPFTVVGDGTQTRDFVFVTDVAKAFLSSAESAHSGEVYNLGAGSPRSVNELIKLLDGKTQHLPKRPGEPDCTWADIRKLTAHTGWTPTISFEDGVRQILQGIEYWRDAPLWDLESIARATKTWFDVLAQEGT